MKKQIKRILAGVLAVATLFLATPISNISTNPLDLKSAYTVSAETYGDLTYKIVDGKVYITACDKTATEVVIPSKINGLPVTSIESGAFKKCNNLTSVIIPNTVKYINHSAFLNCNSLTSITIPSSVTGITYMTFGKCESLTSITVDKNNQYFCDIDGVLFSKDKTTLVAYPAGKPSDKYIVPDFVIDIFDCAFEGSLNLTEVVLPNSIKRIEMCTFYDCINLTKITIPNSVTQIKNYSFTGCNNLTSVVIPSSVKTIEDEAFFSKYLKTIYGYTGSTAEAYANKKKITFIPLDKEFKTGDLNGDGILNSADIVILKQAISGNQKLFPNQAKAADINKDGKIDAFDLISLKSMITK